MPGTTAFPGALDAFPTIDPNTHEDAPGLEHDVVHNNTMAALAAVQEKVGVDGSADASSLDFRLAAVESGKVDASAVGDSVAPLVAGLVPSANLPSYVDDVLEYDDRASFPEPGESGKIYIAVDTSAQYRWSGSTYVQLVASPGTTDALVEGTTNLYFTAQRVRDALLTGLSTATSVVVAATDSVLSAIGKLQAQASALATTVAAKLDSSALDTDGTLAANSDTKVPSQKAVRTYVAAAGGGGGGGTIDPIAASIFRKLVAWYGMNETTGTVMVDSHIHGLHGTYSGVTLNQTGLATNIGASVNFSTAAAYAQVADAALLRPTRGLAIMVWVKRNGAQANFAKIAWKPAITQSNGNANYLLMQDNFSSGGVCTYRSTAQSSSSNTDAKTNSVLADATTYHLIGNRLNDQLQMWRNGTMENTSQFVGDTATTGGYTFRLGSSDGTDGFVGYYGQAAVVEGGLSPLEAAYLYNAGDGISYDALKAAAGY